MINLAQYGWNEWLFQQKSKSNFKDFMHGRVTVTHKTCYQVVCQSGHISCELSGNMLYGREAEEYPCTGDWVLFQLIDDKKGVIMDLFPRRRTLYRLKSGTLSNRQAIASHVDKAFIVQSLDSNFNVRRIERFLLQIEDEGIEAVLVLTKADLDYDSLTVESDLKHLSGRIPVFYTTIHNPRSIELLRESISEGETVVFTGSSGVGKSTLINSLCNRDILKTSAISKSTKKGVHTSTRRQMVLMDRSGVLIDTPGVKLFGVTGDDSHNLSQVLSIDSFEGKCRFKDCKHVNEKGCAVIQAVKDGDIDQGVYDNYIKLRSEAWHYTASVHEKRKQERSFSKMVKHVKNSSLKK